MFNNCDCDTNGEKLFFKHIKHYTHRIFDVGCRNDSIFIDFEGEVHYFDPVFQFIDNLSKQPNKNTKAIFNNFGLGNENKTLYYYPYYQSFYNRIQSCQKSDENNKILLEIKKPKDYMVENNITNIDFLKIDTEGYEFEVLQGFEDYLNNIKIIQFEYGGTFLDNGVKLNDVIEFLKKYGFHKFLYLSDIGYQTITDFSDHYQYCNIVCFNKNLI